MNEDCCESAPLTTDEPGSSLGELQKQLDRFWPGRLAAQSIGRFEVLDELGRGSYGTVFRVRDRNLACERALKVPNPETLASARALERFISEARKASRIDHPNVVRVFEADQDCVIPYIVMEYCAEGSLAGWLALRPADLPVPARWAAALVAEIADGVQQAHAAGILHRDLKPGNVLLTRAGEGRDADLPDFRPKVSDFGLARVLESDAVATPVSSHGGVVGTLAYISPEQARGDAAIRAAADVYSLGVILFELVTKSRPFSGSSDAETLSQILDDAPAPSPRTIRPDLPRDLETVCRTAMAKSVGDRYATAAELADDLRRFVHDEPVKGSHWWKRARSVARRHLTKVSLLGLLVLVLGAGAAGLESMRRKDASVQEYVRKNDASVWLTRLGAASVDALPKLVSDHDPRDPRVFSALEKMFEGTSGTPKLAAAILFSSVRPECADYAYNRLLDAPGEEIRPIAESLNGRMPGLPEALESDTRPPAGKDPRTTRIDETTQRRRANAAAALTLLGRFGPGLDLLNYDRYSKAPVNDPQARSYLIHGLGSIQIPTDVLTARISDRSLDPSIRRALIQSLGEFFVSSNSGKPDRDLLATLYGTYLDDPDSGVHASAKWFLRQWGDSVQLGAIDQELEGLDREGFEWRVSKTRLTLVKIAHPDSGRTLEVSDTEIPRDLFLRLQPNHSYEKQRSPEPDCPISSINYVIAAAFCNQLSREEEIPEGDWCYHNGNEIEMVPVKSTVELSGFRLLTEREFEYVCRSGATTLRYHGDSADLLDRYAWFSPPTVFSSHPVGRLKPNDFGLFDTLGNFTEVCQLTKGRVDPRSQAIYCGGSRVDPALSIRCNHRSDPTSVSQMTSIYQKVGFRVARTVPTHTRRL